MIGLKYWCMKPWRAAPAEENSEGDQKAIMSETIEKNKNIITTW
jgi:hypothetical protein